MSRLFPGDAQETDTRWYSNLLAAQNEYARRVRDFSENAFQEFEGLLDPDFVVKFRRSTPASFSELFYAMAFRDSGLTPAARTSGFDLTFGVPGPRRVLVEVVTPNPPAASSWEQGDHGNFTSYTADQRTMDETLMRLTSSFKRKADDLYSARRDGRVRPEDFCIVAISGVRIMQESPMLLSVMGVPPDFAKAFLPIGPLTVTVTRPRDRDGPLEWSQPTHTYRERIPKGDAGVQQTAFISGEFAHVDAIAYTNAHLSDLSDVSAQVGLLFNPTSPRYIQRPHVGVGVQYDIELSRDEFALTARPRDNAASEYEWG